MADPQFHGFKDMLGDNPKKKSLDYDELLARAKQKKADYEKTKAWIEDESSLKEYLQVPETELALVNYYSSMEEVEISSDVKELWQTQKDELSKIDMRGPQTEYMQAYQQWQEEIENMDDRKRAELGVNNYDRQEANARKGITQAKARLREAKGRVRDIENDVDPFKAMIGVITGSNKDTRTIRDAHKGVREAKKGLKEARKTLKAVQERRANDEQYKAKISVKQTMLLDKMLTAQEKMEANREAAKRINDNVLAVQARLHEQYALIDQYKSIQRFKSSNDYVSARALIKNRDQALFEKIEAFPEALPEKVLKVTLEGPLQLPSNSEKIADLSTKITEIQDRLPRGINLDDLAAELDGFTIREGETIADLESAMARLNPETDEKEYKKLAMKKEHLVAQERIDTLQTEIDNLITSSTHFEETPEYAQLKARIEADFAKKLELEVQRTIAAQVKARVAELKAASQEVNMDAIKAEIDTPENREAIKGTLKEDFDRSCAEKIKVESSKIVQSKLSQLKTNQQVIKLQREQLGKDPYTKTISDLHSLQQLIDERGSLEAQESIVDLETTTQALESSNIPLDESRPVTVSILYTAILSRLAERKEEHIERLTGNTHDRIPLETGREGR